MAAKSVISGAGCGKFSDYVAALYDPALFEAEADPFGIQTIIRFHRWKNRHLLVERLVRGGIWSLIFANEEVDIRLRLARRFSGTGRIERARRTGQAHSGDRPVKSRGAEAAPMKRPTAVLS